MRLIARALPLGVRADLELDARQECAFESLASYDLSLIRDRLIRTGALPRGLVADAVLEFRRWIGLRIIEPRERSVFSRDVDEVWHAFVLHTRLYADFCDRVFGSFIHHNPSVGGFPDIDARFRDFERLYRRVYGDVPPLWYLRPADE